MQKTHLWNRAKAAAIQTAPDIAEGFDIGFDDRIPEATKDRLMDFAYWVEDHFSLPVTLWVDFKYQHYLLDSRKKRVGYRFYWAEFSTYPLFENEADLPVIELAVRTERQTMETILRAFAEGISRYFLWLLQEDPGAYLADSAEISEVLEAYWQRRAQS